MEIDYISLGKKIRQERVNKNLTLEQLAEILGLSASYMGLIERGQRGISIETLYKLANIFNVSTDYLLFSDKYDKEDKERLMHNFLQKQILNLTDQYSKKDLEFIIDFLKLKNKYNR